MPYWLGKKCFHLISFLFYLLSVVLTKNKNCENILSIRKEYTKFDEYVSFQDQIDNDYFIGKIKINDETINYKDIINKIKIDQSSFPLHERNYLDDINIETYQRMYHKKSNINFVLDAMFGSTNEQYGTSYKSRYDDPKYQFAGKTGTSQVRRITDLDRELDLDTEQIEYKKRDHALYVAFAPYKDPRYAISVIIEHGGSGSKAAAPLASKLIKRIIHRHKLREQFNNGKTSLA